MRRGAFAILIAGLGCAGSAGPASERPIRYIGSSTIAQFLRHVQSAHPRVAFEIDSAPESVGGEQAILRGETDLAGVAARPSAEIEKAGIRATLIGRDGIAVIVRSDLPVRGLTLAQLKEIFTGKIRNWKDLGGPDKPVKCFIVSVSSATHKVFRAAVLGEADYAECETVAPDAAILDRVAGTDGGIGHISFSFLGKAQGIRPLWIDDQEPAVTNFDYPITRPLYLLTRPSARAEVSAFVDWTLSPEGQMAVMRFFIGAKVVGSGGAGPTRSASGLLVVYTETVAVYDGGIYYYPHLPYDIFEVGGKLLRHVCNHRSNNDENPARIELPPGNYLIRADGSGAQRREFIVTIRAGEVTEVDVKRLPPKTEK